MNILVIEPGLEGAELALERLAAAGTVVVRSEAPPVEELEGEALVVAGASWVQSQAKPEWVRGMVARGGPPLVVLTTEPGPVELGPLLERGIRHAVHLCPLYGELDLAATLARLLHGELPSPDHFVGPDRLSRVMNLRGSSERRELTALTAEFVSGLTRRPRHRQRALTVLDELVTNALHNAAVDADGRPLHSHLPRTADVKLRKEVRVHLISDGRRFGVRVGDPFGSLQSEVLLETLGRSLVNKAEGATHTGGAGVGLYIVLDMSSHLLIDVAPGRRTDVTSFLDLETGFGDEARMCRSFNLFSRVG